jgi:hypothetical protein
MLPTKFLFILAKQFQRRRFKGEKLIDDGRQLMPGELKMLDLDIKIYTNIHSVYNMIEKK